MHTNRALHTVVTRWSNILFVSKGTYTILSTTSDNFMEGSAFSMASPILMVESKTKAVSSLSSLCFFDWLVQPDNASIHNINYGVSHKNSI